MFILYFVLAAIITTVSLHMGVNSNVFLPIKELSKFLIIMAMVLIGLNSNVIHLIKTGGKPLLVGASCWCGITIVSLLMQRCDGYLVIIDFINYISLDRNRLTVKLNFHCFFL